jgi:hypothetical protein
MEKLTAAPSQATLQEIQRIKRLFEPKFDDAEDLLSYANEVVTLRLLAQTAECSDPPPALDGE